MSSLPATMKESDEKKAENKWRHRFFSIITLWHLSVAMETRVMIRSHPNTLCSQPPTPMLLQMKFGCDLHTSLRDICVWKWRHTHARTDGRRLDWYTISSPLSLRLRWAKMGVCNCKICRIPLFWNPLWSGSWTSEIFSWLCAYLSDYRDRLLST